MSEKNGKVCCNCRHNIRTEIGKYIRCECDIDNHCMTYTKCMTGWCKHWAKDKKWEEGETNEADNDHV